MDLAPNYVHTSHRTRNFEMERVAVVGQSFPPTHILYQQTNETEPPPNTESAIPTSKVDAQLFYQRSKEPIPGMLVAIEIGIHKEEGRSSEKRGYVEGGTK